MQEMSANITINDAQSSINPDTTSKAERLIDQNPMIRHLLAKRDVWESKRYGNRKVFCNGKIMIGPVRIMWWLLELLGVITAITFLTEYLVFEKVHIGVAISGLVLYAIFLISSWKTLLCDPGVLIKPNFETALENAREAVQMGTRFPSKDFEINNRIVNYKYCVQCHFFRDPRARHCSVCNACVQELDHHCPVFGGCIGKNNLFSFHVMVFSVMIYFAYLTVTGIIVLSTSLRNNSDRITAELVFSASYTLDLVVCGAILGIILCPIVTALNPQPREDTIIRPFPARVKLNKVYPISPYKDPVRGPQRSVNQRSMYQMGDHSGVQSIYTQQSLSEVSVHSRSFY